MTTLTLTSLFVAPVSNPASPIVLAQSAWSATVASTATRRRYANGRDRLITTPGSSSDWTFEAKYQTRSTYLQLVDLIGDPICVRDQRGLVLWGFMADVSSTEMLAQDLLATITFTVTRITYSEVV